MSIIPSYLIFLTAALVILPSFVAMILRFFLYQHLREQAEKVRRLVNQQSPGKPLKIVEELEKRFAQASSNLDEVNTAALIDQVYSQEKVLGISCEQIDYLSRFLPNLLLAFGLMGTFIGITINLTSLSQTISQSNVSDVNTLVQQLQEPLQGMGIAFITSLTGLFFSALLTVVNFLFNTRLAKYQLLSSLEDYLDNIYHPTLQGQTRLDKVVKGMADTFDHFLTRFGQTVREGVESALKDKIQEITEANLKAAHLAEQVYSQLANAAGTISRGSDDFQKAADRFIEVAEIFEDSKFPQKLSETTANLATTQENFYKSASILADNVKFIEAALNEVQQIVARLDSLDKMQEELVKVVEALNNSTQQVNQGMEVLGERLVSINHQTTSSNAQSLEMISQIEQGIAILRETKTEMQMLRNQLEEDVKQKEFLEKLKQI